MGKEERIEFKRHRNEYVFSPSYATLATFSGVLRRSRLREGKEKLLSRVAIKLFGRRIKKKKPSLPSLTSSLGRATMATDLARRRIQSGN